MTRAPQAPPAPDPTGAPEARPAGRRPRRTVVAAGIAVIAVGVALGLAVAGDGDDRSGTTTVESTTTEAPADESTTPGDVATVPSVPGTEASAAPVIEDGRHAVYLTGLDVGPRTIEFDVVQWLTGEEARAAYTADHPDDPGGPPNDYYVVNENPRLRVLPVAGDATVTVLEHGFEPTQIAFEDLPAFLADDALPDDRALWHDPFWLTVRGDTVTAIEEQYIP